MSDENNKFQRRFEILQQQFRQDLPARLQHILDAGEKWLQAGEPENGGDFQTAVHKLAGSAGNFGFDEITILCQQIEDAMRERSADSRQRVENGLQGLRALAG